jgi:hypothetical protein
MILAAHQPSFIPWLPWWRKLFLTDRFVLMVHSQFEKNNYINRCKVKEKWWTVPVNGRIAPISEIYYVNGQSLAQTNINLIRGFMGVFGISQDKLVYDRPRLTKGTDALIEMCMENGCTEYLTNPEAEQKYLDVGLMEKAGIKMIPFTVTNDYKISLFEAFEKWGIEGTRKMICRT